MDTDEMERMQVEYSDRIRRCLTGMRKDYAREPLYLAVVLMQTTCLSGVIMALWMVLRDNHFLHAAVWVMIGIQASAISMCFSNWFYLRRSARLGAVALALLPKFESAKYPDSELLFENLNHICSYVEKASRYLMLEISYCMGWRRKASMAGGILSVCMLAWAASRPDDILLVAGASFAFGFFVTKGLYIIFRSA